MTEAVTYFEDTDIETLDSYVENPAYVETESPQETELYPVSETELHAGINNESIGTIEQSTQLLVDRKGGTSEDWATTSRSEGGVFDGKEIYKPDGVSLTKEIEARGIPEEIAEHHEMLHQWAEGGERVVFLPDHIEIDGDERRQFVTMMILDEDGRNVSYEIRETVTRIPQEEEHNVIDFGSETSTTYQREISSATAEELPLSLVSEQAAEAEVAAHAEVGNSDSMQEEPTREQHGKEAISEESGTIALQPTIETAELVAFLDIDAKEDRMFVDDSTAVEQAPVAESSVVTETSKEVIENIPPIQVEFDRQESISISEKDTQQVESPMIPIASSGREKTKHSYIQEKVSAASYKDVATQTTRKEAVVKQEQESRFAEKTQIATTSEVVIDRTYTRAEVSHAQHGNIPSSHMESEHNKPEVTTGTGAVENIEQHAGNSAHAEAESKVEQDEPRADAKEYGVRIEQAADMLSYALGIPPQRTGYTAPDESRKESSATALPFRPQTQEEEPNHLSAPVRSLRGITLSRAA